MPLRLSGRLPVTLPRSFASQWRRRSYAHFKPDRGLRILFCGADDFSIPSLRALNDLRLTGHRVIDHIDVLHRKAKYVGRGLTTLKEAPIKAFASELGLTTHARENLKNWTPPRPIDLIVAASFGLLIPYAILRLSTHGGLNVHPSLLPDLQGAAPIEHAILKKRQYTGMTVQTLHPTHFDQGKILAQTSAPGIPISDKTGPQLKAELADLGAEMLIQVLKTGKYMQPYEPAGWYTKALGPIEAAPRIVKQDTRIDFLGTNLEHMILAQRAMGGTWVILPNNDRLIIHNMVDTGRKDLQERVPGVYVQKGHTYPLIRDRHGAIGEIRESTYAGGTAKEGNKVLFRIFRHERGNDILLPDEVVEKEEG